jgi:hypothetical protein
MSERMPGARTTDLPAPFLAVLATLPVQILLGPPVVVVQTAEYGDRFDRAFDLRYRWNRLLLAESLVTELAVPKNGQLSRSCDAMVAIRACDARAGGKRGV